MSKLMTHARSWMSGVYHRHPASAPIEGIRSLLVNFVHTGAIRVDNNSAFGEDFKWVTYPKVSAAWVMSEEPFWNIGCVVDAFKLRAAYGQSGQQPNAFVALRTVTNAPRANGTPGVTPGSLGNPDLEPESSWSTDLGLRWYGEKTFLSGQLFRLDVDDYIERYANPYVAAERGYVDDVIDPADTRAKLIAGLDMLRSKREELPKRKHGNVPL